MEERSGTLRRAVVAIGLALALGCLLAPSALARQEAQEAGEGHDHLALQAGTPGQPVRARLRHDADLAHRPDLGHGGREARSQAEDRLLLRLSRPSATTRAPTPTSRSTRRSARSRSIRRRATACTAACSRPMYRQVTLQAILSGGAITRRARQIAYGDVVSRLEDLPAQVQPGPRRGPDRPLPGHLRPARADPPGRRPEARGAQAAGLGDPAGRQRDRARRAATSGGDFKHIPGCRKPKQTGCVIAFSTFNAPVPNDSLFGRPSRRGARPADDRRRALHEPGGARRRLGAAHARSSRRSRSRPARRSASRPALVGVPLSRPV